MSALNWRAGKPVETIVPCCGCGSNIAVAESRVTEIPGREGSVTSVFSCSPECEEKFEKFRATGKKV